jgi:hypothetical protein
VSKPTLILAGERGGEHIVPAAEMQAMQAAMRGTASGSQAPAISVHNYPDKASAEQGAERSRAQGETAIVNAVNANLARGESSSILRTLRSLQK